MDLNDIRTIMVVVAFLTFLGIVAWAYGGGRKESFERAARMALEDDEPTLQNNRSDK